MIGDINSIDDKVTALKENGLVLKIMEGLQDYLSCKIKFSTDKKRAWLGQPHLIKNLKNEFGQYLQEICNYKMPGMPKFMTVRPKVESKKISVEDQQDYWLSVGMLLYLVNHLHPNLANATSALSKANDGVNPAAYKELLHVIKYVLTLVSRFNPLQISTNAGKLYISMTVITQETW